MKGYPVVLNGELLDGERLFPAWNRGFHFGDGLFETMRAIDRVPPFLKAHIRRASEGVERMGIRIPHGWKEEKLMDEIEALLEEWGDRHARIRISIFRTGAGAYTPQNELGEYLIERTGSCEGRFPFPENGLEVELYGQGSFGPDPLSPYKTLSALPYVMAQRWAAENGYDEALLQGSEGKVLEASSSNLFLFKGDRWITPPISDGCVDGVMRRVLLELLSKEDIRLEERSVYPQDLKGADEVLLCNAVRGIFPVTGFRGCNFGRSRSEQLARLLNERALS